LCAKFNIFYILGNWIRLRELLPSISAKGSGIEKMTSLFEGELELELFIEGQRGTILRLIQFQCFLFLDRVQPNQRFYVYLRKAEGYLKQAIALNELHETVVMEAHLLRAKLHYLLENFTESLDDIRQSKLDQVSPTSYCLRNNMCF
jgi:hypothetical protein